MVFDPAMQRKIMGRFVTGVTLVTTRFSGGFWGMTANSVTSLSLDPPLVLVSVDRNNQMREYMVEGQCFAINVLTTAQEAISRKFATRGPKDFSGIDITTAETGAPILVGALAYVDCQVVNVVEGGDHDIFIGRVVAGDMGSGQPLTFYNGRYAALVPEAAFAGPFGPEMLEDAYLHYGSF